MQYVAAELFGTLPATRPSSGKLNRVANYSVLFQVVKIVRATISSPV
jgi:hypothetical protein